MARDRGVANVMVAYPVAVPWVALFVRGVIDYAQRHGGWNVLTSPPTLTGASEFSQSVYNLRGWPGDGVMAVIRTAAEARVAARLGIPVVNFSGAMQHTGLPRVSLDNYAVGCAAAEHLLERGHRRLAYCGIRGLWFSEQRCLGFAERAAQAGVACDVFEAVAPSDPHASWHKQVAPLIRWLRSLKPPVGMLAVQDYRARVVLDECLRLGLDVPHDVAILGVDNDPTVCEFCRPTLSSVSRNAWRMGQEAASLLDRLMAGQSVSSESVVLPPDGIAARQSTDTVVIDDPYVAAAVHFMRDHAAEPFNVAQIMGRVPISRRQFEIRFRRAFDCTPLDYLNRLRVKRAKAMLDGPQHIKLHTVAAACGFASEERMRLVFCRVTGTTPRDYQRAAAGRAPRNEIASK